MGNYAWFCPQCQSDISLFNHIVPCGINDKSVTSLAQGLGYEIDMQEVKTVLLKKF